MTEFKSNKISLVFEGDTQETISRLALEDHPNRTGGILVGRYTDDLSCACVTRIIPPPPGSKIGPDQFLRGVEGLKEIIDECWNSQERSYYLGEWHSRPQRLEDPLNVDPSALDIESMIEIAEDRDTNCPQPMLVVVGVWVPEKPYHHKQDRTSAVFLSHTKIGVYGFDRGSTDFIRLTSNPSN